MCIISYCILIKTCGIIINTLRRNMSNIFIFFQYSFNFCLYGRIMILKLSMNSNTFFMIYKSIFKVTDDHFLFLIITFEDVIIFLCKLIIFWENFSHFTVLKCYIIDQIRQKWKLKLLNGILIINSDFKIWKPTLMRAVLVEIKPFCAREEKYFLGLRPSEGLVIDWSRFS